jgi:succinate dehydrogenase / fumarate reductase, iron-sulfur subunit
MSEFTLPANSKVGEGKHWALPKPAKHVKSFRIYRWNPAKNANPTMDTFDIDRDHCGPMSLMRWSRSTTRSTRHCLSGGPVGKAFAAPAR